MDSLHRGVDDFADPQHVGRIVNYVAVKRDISEHLRLTAQFQQAQKMEAVGLRGRRGPRLQQYARCNPRLYGTSPEQRGPGSQLHAD